MARFGSVLFSVILLLVPPVAAANDDVLIGVLAKRGAENTLTRWQSVADYLTDSIPEQRFAVVPLDFNQVEPAVIDKEVDFLFVNPGLFVELEYQYQIRPIATVLNERQGRGLSLFSGLIIVSAANRDVKRLPDLKGKRFAAVEEKSLGGWLMAKRELKISGIDTDQDFRSLEFMGTHDEVVNAVLAGVADVGAVRSDTLEHMEREGLIVRNAVKVLHAPRNHFNYGLGEDDFPFVHSTDIYPEWPMAKLPDTSSELANRVAIALLAMPRDGAAARKAAIAGWDVPRNYQSVHDLYRELRIGPYEYIEHLQLVDVWQKYRFAIVGLLILFGVLIALVWQLISMRRQLIDAKTQVTHVAMHDPLTKLPNRLFFDALAEKTLALAQRGGWKVYILLIDLDGFKEVNDNFGHEAGDKVLRRISRRLRQAFPQRQKKPLPSRISSDPSAERSPFEVVLEDGGVVRKEDLIARHGGDEFLGLLADVKTLEDAKHIVDRILRAVEEPVDVTAGEVRLSASIGISVFPDDGTTLKELRKKADQSMYAAKQEGRGSYRLFSELAPE